MAEEELKAVSFLPCVTFWNLSPDLSAWGIRTFVFSKHFGHDEGQVHFLLPLHFLGLWWLLPISLFQIWQWWWGVMTLAVFSLMSRNIVRHAVLQQLWRSTKVIRYLPLCVSSRSLWQNTWHETTQWRKGFFWLMVSEVSVPGQLAPLLSGCGEAEYMVGRAAHLMVAGNRGRSWGPISLQGHAHSDLTSVH